MRFMDDGTYWDRPVPLEVKIKAIMELVAEDEDLRNELLKKLLKDKAVRICEDQFIIRTIEL